MPDPAQSLAFEPGYYASRYADMASFEPALARAHFISHGIREGRIGAPGGIREELLESLPQSELVLEIGPFAGPSLHGANIRYADVMPTAELRARATSLGIDPTHCPEIHYVLRDFDLARIPDRFAAVFSSHCIEHQPDLVRHLQAVENLLDDTGCYFLIVPDQRYCFDHYLHPSTIADVMTAYARGSKVHELGSIIEHWAMTTHNETTRHWAGDHGEPRIQSSNVDLENAIRCYAESHGEYIDVHAWQFTPASFAHVTSLLHKLGLTRLKPAETHNTPFNRNEFCAILQKTNPRTLATDRPTPPINAA